jgi:hypothetical protein
MRIVLSIQGNLKLDKVVTAPSNPGLQGDLTVLGIEHRAMTFRVIMKAKQL